MTDHRSRRSVALSIAVALLVVACGSSTASPSPSPVASPSAASTSSPAASAAGSPATSPGPSASQDADAIYDAIEQQVIEIRGLKPTAKVARQTIDEDRLREMLTEQFDKDSPPEYTAANERLYKALGLIPQDADLRALSLDLLGAGVAGFYDNEKKEMFVVSRSGNIGGQEKITYAHEYTHALQDQNYSVFKDQQDVKDRSDWLLARQAIYEGDATLLMTYWGFTHMTAEELTQASTVDPAQQEVMNKMPAILQETLLYPYSTGALYVQQAQAAGGWPGVNDFYKRMPVSTEQILHPEKYAADEPAIDVQLPKGLAKDLGKGWSVPLSDTFGELQTGIWLRASGVPRAQADAAAAGWGGDRLAVINGPDGAWALVMHTVWDTAADAEEFEAAATTALAKAGGVAQVVPGTGGTTRWVVVGSDDKTASKVAGVLGLAG